MWLESDVSVYILGMGDCRMMKQEANIYEIAKEAGVSIATVSRVMNNSCTVSEKSKKRVLDAVEKLNYVPNSAARSLSTSTSTSVGVVIPDINNPFFSRLLQGITSAADEMGLNIFLFGTDESSDREHRVLDTMREHRLRGIIITPVSYQDSLTQERLQNFQKLGIPVVLLDRELDCLSFDRVVTDDDEGVYRAVSELIRLGHRRIAIITGPDDSRPGRERLRGYCRALEDHGIPLRPEYICKGDFKVDCACEHTRSLCSLPEPPTAIFASNNMTTYGCLKAFGELKIQPGADMALFGFDNIPELGWLNYNISAVIRDVPRMGEQAMRLLMRRFDSREVPEEGIRICLPTELVLRGSEQMPTG